MNAGKRMLGVLLLAASVAGAQTQTPAGQTPADSRPKTEEQIRLEKLTERMEQMERDMQDLKQQLQQAKDAAATAQAAADLAAKKTEEVKQNAGDNAQAVTALQGTVAALKTSSTAAIDKVQVDQKQAKTDFEHPDILHYKGITLSPNGSFIAGETVDRIMPRAETSPRRGPRFRLRTQISRRRASSSVPDVSRASHFWPRVSDKTSPSRIL